jgi:2-phospho-L-lactate guanylyltransferase (CobY/MobA/RfbA family)
MKEESERQTADENHKVNCLKKLDVLNDQRKDLCSAIDQLIEDIESGKKYIKVYKQMKMYNDEDLNPVLYKSK